MEVIMKIIIRFEGNEALKGVLIKPSRASFFYTIRKYKLSLYTARRANTCEDSVFVGASQVFFILVRKLYTPKQGGERIRTVVQKKFKKILSKNIHTIFFNQSPE